MAELNVVTVGRIAATGGLDGYRYLAAVEEEGQHEAVTVEVAGTQSVVAGFGPDGPSHEWIAEALRRYAQVQGLENYRPVLDQVREWPSPVILTADYA